jgi:hypothetical protein
VIDIGHVTDDDPLDAAKGDQRQLMAGGDL